MAAGHPAATCSRRNRVKGVHGVQRAARSRGRVGGVMFRGGAGDMFVRLVRCYVSVLLRGGC